MAPGTGFVEDNFSTDWGSEVGDGSGGNASNGSGNNVSDGGMVQVVMQAMVQEVMRVVGGAWFRR